MTVETQVYGMAQKGIEWRDPKDFAITFGKILASLAGAMVITGALTVALPYNNYVPQTPERFLIVGVFYTSWMLLAFRLLFGEFIPLKLLKTNGT
jgi:hypothetical protein